MATIKSITAREILDSRGKPTLETTVVLDDESVGVASVPSGASVGTHEAIELRDGEVARFGGQGVMKAINHVQEIIAPALKGKEAGSQKEIDQLMINLDGTENKAKLGANALLSVSIGVSKAAALGQKLPLFKYLAQLYDPERQKFKIPTPVLNLINGGKHGGGNLEFQEFHIVPDGQKPYPEVLRMAVEVYLAVRKVLLTQGEPPTVGDEGGFAPRLSNNFEGLRFLLEAIKLAGCELQKDIFLGLDVAANYFYKEGKYEIKDRPEPLITQELIGFYHKLAKEYPLRLLEDPLAEDDWEGWSEITRQLTEVTIVGDDLLTTNPKRLKQAIEKKACGAVIVKPNQIGTLSETLEVVRLASQAGWKIIVSNRSGETNDDFLADLSVGVGADYAKFGAPARGERVAKYNRLLAIEKEIEKK